jgi:hypothetical protein
LAAARQGIVAAQTAIAIYRIPSLVLQDWPGLPVSQGRDEGTLLPQIK